MKEKLIFLDIDGVLNSELYARRFFDEKLYEKIERKEYWMDADEMKRLGIVDEII